MCGRFTLTAPESALAQLFDVPDWPAGTTPRYNIAPTQTVAMVAAGRDAEGEHRRRAGPAHWGLIPHWAQDRQIAYKLINARIESVASKPAFKSALRRKRCLIPADGFYEWQPRPGQRSKQPYRIHRPDGAPFAFAGLWARWQPEDGAEPLISCTILTAAANAAVAAIHARMPVMLPPAWFDAWLAGPADIHDGATAAPDLTQFAGAMPAAELTATPVDPRVGNPRYDDPALMTAV